MSEVSASSFERGQAVLAPIVALVQPRSDRRQLSGFLVVDFRGRVVGRVRKPRFGSSGHSPGALTVRYGFLGLRHCLVTPDLIEQIDAGAKVIGLRAGRKALRAGRA